MAPCTRQSARRTARHRCAGPAGAVLVIVAVVGCRSGPSVDALPALPAPPATLLSVAPGAYESAFADTIADLRRDGWTLDRVDAGAGEITTLPRRSAGLLSPFVRVAPTLRQDLRETIQGPERTVRVVFRTPNRERPSTDPQAAMTARVEVTLYAPVDTGKRLSPVDIRFVSFAQNPLRRRPRDPIALGRDAASETRFAARLADRSGVITEAVR